MESSTATGALFITKSLFAPSEPVAAGLAKVKLATFKLVSFIVPELSSKELEAT